jgi:hypothetical protein
MVKATDLGQFDHAAELRPLREPRLRGVASQ